jgi:hypothetical protein
MTEKQTDNTLPDLQNRFKYCKISVLTALLLLFAPHFIRAQTWSEPSVIFTANKFSGFPDFTFDNNGNIHCVWATKHGTNYYRIYYSKSIDDGDTWTTPINASMNDTKWMDLPHIVCDQNNTLHLTYDYDVGNLYNSYIFHRKFNGISWVFSDTVTKGYPGATKNRLVIDNNDKLYCFWSTGYYTVYHTLEPGANSWSDIILPYGDSITLFTHKPIVGTDNVIHFQGFSNIIGNKFTVSYFKLYEGNWSPIEEISLLIRGYRFDMALDNQGFPHIVWHQFSTGSSVGEDSIMYRYYNGYFWSNPELIIQGANNMSIAIDPSNTKHLLLNVREDSIYSLKHYRNSNGNWEEPQTIDENDYSYLPQKTIYRDGKLYHLYSKIDTVINSMSAYTSILMRKLEIVTTNTDYNKSSIDNLVIAPNPFRFYTKIEFEIHKKEKLEIQVYNVHGIPVNTLLNELTMPGRIELTWDGMDFNGKKVTQGIYIVRIRSESITISKILKFIF